ncbi:MAG: twin-arginine translocase subunit TatC [Flavobacteriales bacterium]|nr:twin-arginine translocase subunit TatC [Flavobacteriales bacterium]
MAPGLKEKERNAVSGIVVFVILLFLLGAGFGYWVLAPMSFQFFSGYSLSPSSINYGPWTVMLEY